MAQLEQLNEKLKDTGFAYDLQQDCFYSRMNCWQREVGYCHLYDEGALTFNMVMDSEPIPFSYGGKRWLIELWKGQYGITTGAEIGLYNTTLSDVHSKRFTGTFYESVSDAERMPLSFVLRDNNQILMRRSRLHWWLTGFRLGDFSKPADLTMDAQIVFPNRDMLGAFLESLMNIGYTSNEYSVRRNTITIHYTTPHTPQPSSRNGLQEAAVLKLDKEGTRLYEGLTAGYSDTLDKLEFLADSAPELFVFMLGSLYARGVFDAYEWIRDIIGFPDPTRPGPPDPIDPIDPPDPADPVCRPCCHCLSRPTLCATRHRYTLQGHCSRQQGRDAGSDKNVSCQYNGKDEMGR